jgi:two-component system chemotaxis response regulator CheB
MDISIISVLIAGSDITVINKISDILSNNKEIKITGIAYNGYQALKMVAKLKPNVVLMDIALSVKDGFDAIVEIMSNHAAPILVWSSTIDKDRVEDVLSKGALEVISTVDINAKEARLLIKKLIQLSKIKVITHLQKHSSNDTNSETSIHRGKYAPTFNKIIAIASSTGGPMALAEIVKRLPADFEMPIVIAQHITHEHIDRLIKYLRDYTKITIKEGADGEDISPCAIYISPSNKHMEITSFGRIKLIEITIAEIYHPSCDRLLSSVASAYGKIAIGIILTGMGHDGVQGMKDIKRAGGTTIAQDKKSSTIFGMANVAIQQGCIDKILPLDKIGQEIIKAEKN